MSAATTSADTVTSAVVTTAVPVMETTTEAIPNLWPEGLFDKIGTNSPAQAWDPMGGFDHSRVLPAYYFMHAFLKTNKWARENRLIVRYRQRLNWIQACDVRERVRKGAELFESVMEPLKDAFPVGNGNVFIVNRNNNYFSFVSHITGTAPQKRAKLQELHNWCGGRDGPPIHVRQGVSIDDYLSIISYTMYFNALDITNGNLPNPTQVMSSEDVYAFIKKVGQILGHIPLVVAPVVATEQIPTVAELATPVVAPTIITEGTPIPIVVPAPAVRRPVVREPAEARPLAALAQTEAVITQAINERETVNEG